MSASYLMGLIKGALMRVLIHAGALVAGMCITLSEHSIGAFAGFLEFLCAYTGLILLCRPVFEGIKRCIYCIPLLFGIAEALVCLYLGMAPGASLFSGGLITFISRRLIYGRENLSEFLILPLLIFLAIALSPSFYQLFYLNLAHITIPCALVLCYLVLLVSLKIERRVLSRLNCFKAQKELLDLSSKLAKLDLSKSLKEVASLLEQLLKISPEIEAGNTPFKESIELVKTVKKLFDLGQEELGQDSKVMQGQDDTAKLHQAINMSSLDANVKLLAKDLKICIKKLGEHKEEKNHQESKAKQSKYPLFDESVARLLALANEENALSIEIKTPLLSICKSAEHLIVVLNSGAESNAPLEAFLSRYLTKTESIIADYLNFRRMDDGSYQELIKRINSVLDRLAKAFIKECDDLKRSRAEEFEAELKAFEEFMRMNGK